MCLSLLSKPPKFETPQLPPPPPTPSPPPTPTAVDSQTQKQDANIRRRKQIRAGLLSTIKTNRFNAFAEPSQVGSSLG